MEQILINEYVQYESGTFYVQAEGDSANCYDYWRNWYPFSHPTYTSYEEVT